jgi:hypothetical protein
MMKKSIAVISLCLSMFLVACSDSDSQKQQASAQPAKPKLSPEEIQRRTDDKALNDIWNAYTNYPGNAGQGTKWINVKGKIIKQGTVPPSAVNSSAKGRLPAYLACYDYVSVMSGLGDIEGNMCIYYINNPTRGTYAVMWRGKKYMSQLESSMAGDHHKQGHP